MNRFHTTIVALLLAVAGAGGTYAATRSTSHGTTTKSPAVAARTKQLDAFEAKLHRRLAAAQSTQQPSPAAQPQQVIVRRAAPIVVTLHKQHGDDEGEGGGDD